MKAAAFALAALAACETLHRVDLLLAPNAQAPVIVRAVATQESCTEIELTNGALWVSVDKTKALGCAYSCPVQLDAVDGPISLGLDVLDKTQCVPTMQACAAFPGM